MKIGNENSSDLFQCAWGTEASGYVEYIGWPARDDVVETGAALSPAGNARSMAANHGVAIDISNQGRSKVINNRYLAKKILTSGPGRVKT